MKLESFFGGSYESQAFTADCSKLVNWYPELLQDPGATARRILLPTPGVELIVDTLFRPGRAHFVQNGREFSVQAGRFCEFSSTGLITAHQTTGGNDMVIDGNPATIDSNGDGGNQIFIVTAGFGYIYELLTNSLIGVTPSIGANVQFGAYLDGYFIGLDTNDSRFYVSNLYDGLAAWSTGNAQRSLAADRWISMRVLGRGIWLLGELTSEVWFNTGDRFPFAPHPSGVLQYGILAPWSAVVAGDDLLWLAGSRFGRVCVMRVSGVEPEIVSTLPLEKTMAGYLGLETAIADSYSENGHVFYRLNFDIDGVTWVYDLTTKLWHEQGAWLSEEARYTVARQRFHAYAFGEHRILDSANGNLYRMSQDLPRDVDGRPIRRMRRGPAMSDELRRVFYPEFELDLEPGLGRSGCQVGFSMIDAPLELSEILVDAPSIPAPSDSFVNFSVAVTGGDDGGPFEYEWSVWGDVGGTEEAPFFVSTDAEPAMPHTTAICASYAKVRVFEPHTAALAQTQPQPFTAHCP